MSRPPEHPSGKKRIISVTLAPATVDAADAMAANLGMNRSQLVAWALARAWAAEQPPEAP